MRCGKQEHQPGQRCPAKNTKCKECHKIGHFHKVCQCKKRATQKTHLVQAPQDNDDTHIDGNGVRQPNPPPRVNMFKVVNHIKAHRGKFSEGKHLKFSIVSHPKGPYNHHIMVRVDTGADVNCMNENTFNGMVNYLNQNSALSAHIAAPLSASTHQAVDYKPSKVHFENFNGLKVEFSNVGALPYFDVNAETTLQMDASKKGLGTCIIQKGKVVCYASRALTKTEQNYQNLEREALGTIWGMEKFHYFFYGKEFTLKTDQKLLVSIYKKHMIDISPRVQRLIVRSFPNLLFKVVYKKGVDIPVADALSRVTSMDPEDNIRLLIIAVKIITT